MFKIIIFAILSIIFAYNSNRILLRDITALTLHKNQYTEGRRSKVSQLKCISNCKEEPSTVQCKNVGFDGKSVNWECKADMDKSLSFDRLRVSCEGYDRPGDDYVLVGSCGLEYSLKDNGNYKNNRNRNRNNGYNRNQNVYVDNTNSGSSFLFFIIIIAVIIAIYCIFFKKRTGTIYSAPNANNNGEEVVYETTTTYSNTAPIRRNVYTNDYVYSNPYDSTNYVFPTGHTTIINNNYDNDNYSYNRSNNNNSDSDKHESTGYADTDTR